MRRLLTVMFAAALLAPSPARASDVTRDWDKTYDYSRVHTFTIRVGTAWGNPLSEDRVLSEIADAINAKGWRRVQSGTPADVLVVLHGATETRHTLNTFYNSTGGWGGYGWGGSGGSSSATTTVEDYVVGTLVVDIFDAKTEKLLYRGTASDELSKSPAKNQKKVDKAAQKLFKDFPVAEKS